MSNPGNEKLESIQILRALAAVAVIWGHSWRELDRYHPSVFDGRAADFFSIGRIGVDIFFVISGFVMVYVSSHHFGKAGESASFLMRRAFRVIPIYWFYTTIILLVSLAVPSVLRGTDFSAARVVASYMFFPLFSSIGEDFHPILGVGWTLNYEMYFYVLFTPILLLSREKGIVALFVLFLAITMAGLFLDESAGALWFWSRPIILEFAAGAVIAQLYLRGMSIPRPVSAICICIALVWIFYTAVWWNKGNLNLRFLVTGIPALLLVFGVIFGSIRSASGVSSHLSRWLIGLGDASYSLYLVHMFFVRAVTKLLPEHVLGAFYVPLYFVTVFSLCIGAAFISYRLIEKPSNRKLRQWAQI